MLIYPYIHGFRITFWHLGHLRPDSKKNGKANYRNSKFTELSLKSYTVHFSQGAKSLKFEELPDTKQDILEKLEFHGLL